MPLIGFRFFLYDFDNFRKVGKASRNMLGKYQLVVYRNFKGAHFLRMDEDGFYPGFGLYGSGKACGYRPVIAGPAVENG